MSGGLALIGLTGSRLWPAPQLLEDTLLGTWHDALQIGYTGIELMHGTAEGADTIGGQWADRNGILVRERAADWNGPCGPECQPGHRRNQQMVDEKPVLLVAASYRNSSGTADCSRRATKAGIPVHTITA